MFGTFSNTVQLTLYGDQILLGFGLFTFIYFTASLFFDLEKLGVKKYDSAALKIALISSLLWLLAIVCDILILSYSLWRSYKYELPEYEQYAIVNRILGPYLIFYLILIAILLLVQLLWFKKLSKTWFVRLPIALLLIGFYFGINRYLPASSSVLYEQYMFKSNLVWYETIQFLLFKVAMFAGFAVVFHHLQKYLSRFWKNLKN